MDILSKLNTLLVESFKSSNTLEEKSENMSVPIESNTSYLSYSFDKNVPSTGLFPFFNKTKLVHAMCDYIIFCFHSNRLYVLLVELKHGGNNVTKQLKAGKCFAEFVVSTLNRIENLNIIPEIRCISIRNKNIINKRTTKIREAKYDENDLCNFSGNRFRVDEFLK